MTTLIHKQDDAPIYEQEDREKLSKKLKTYHIHVYRVVGVVEFDVTAKDDVTALNAAIDKAQGVKYKIPDCNVIAIIPKEEEDAPTNEVSPNIPNGNHRERQHSGEPEGNPR